MLRIAVQSKGRLYEDTMNLLKETGIKINSARRTLLVQSSNFPLEVLYLRDDDIPECVASGVADIGIVGENEFVERGEDANIVSVSLNAAYHLQYQRRWIIRACSGLMERRLPHRTRRYSVSLPRRTI